MSVQLSIYLVKPIYCLLMNLTPVACSVHHVKAADSVCSSPLPPLGFSQPPVVNGIPPQPPYYPPAGFQPSYSVPAPPPQPQPVPPTYTVPPPAPPVMQSSSHGVPSQYPIRPSSAPLPAPIPAPIAVSIPAPILAPIPTSAPDSLHQVGAHLNCSLKKSQLSSVSFKPAERSPCTRDANN